MGTGGNGVPKPMPSKVCASWMYRCVVRRSAWPARDENLDEIIDLRNAGSALPVHPFHQHAMLV
jgi:hypothetical protein